jgi:hypothetical protein
VEISQLILDLRIKTEQIIRLCSDNTVLDNFVMYSVS